jgi:hypothetical protein
METLITLYADNPNVPHNDTRGQIVTLNAVFIAFTVTIIITRLLVRSLIVRHVLFEDYLMALAGVFATAFSAMNIVGEFPYASRLPPADLLRNNARPRPAHLRPARAHPPPIPNLHN